MKEIVDQIRKLQETNGLINQLPIHSKSVEFFEELIQFLFPIRSDDLDCELTSDENINKIKDLLLTILYLCPCGKIDINSVTNSFFMELPRIYKELIEDAKLILNNDPAARSIEEIILTYPGFFAIATYRICHALHNFKIPVLPRLISEYAHSKTGIDIHPGAKIQSPFFIDHGTGVVIGETCEIGKGVKIYQGVTLGASIVNKGLADQKRHPTIEDNVVIYANATILGGKTIVGHDSVIGGNVWLTKSLAPNSTIYYKASVEIKDEYELMFNI